MDFQSLCEISDRELKAGLADPILVQRALTEAKGVEAHAAQIFWHLRAKELTSESEESVRGLVAQIEAQEKRLRRRKDSNRWFWALACMSGLIGMILCSASALRAVGKPGPALLTFLVLTIASAALAVIAFTASRYHTNVD